MLLQTKVVCLGLPDYKVFDTYVALAVAEKDAAEQKLSSCMLIIHPHKLIHYILSIFVQNQVFEINRSLLSASLFYYLNSVLSSEATCNEFQT